LFYLPLLSALSLSRDALSWALQIVVIGVGRTAAVLLIYDQISIKKRENHDTRRGQCRSDRTAEADNEWSNGATMVAW
jgi:hypothetical protein